MATMPQDVVQPEASRLDEERLAWLALTLTPGLGPKRILDAMQAAGSAKPDLACR